MSDLAKQFPLFVVTTWAVILSLASPALLMIYWTGLLVEELKNLPSLPDHSTPEATLNVALSEMLLISSQIRLSPVTVKVGAGVMFSLIKEVSAVQKPLFKVVKPTTAAEAFFSF